LGYGFYWIGQFCTRVQSRLIPTFSDAHFNVRGMPHLMQKHGLVLLAGVQTA
jgi:hypothetical protein